MNVRCVTPLGDDLQLRLLHQLEGSSGNTVLLGIPASAVPLPPSGKPAADPTPPDSEA